MVPMRNGFAAAVTLAVCPVRAISTQGSEQHTLTTVLYFIRLPFFHLSQGKKKKKNHSTSLFLNLFPNKQNSVCAGATRHFSEPET